MSKSSHLESFAGSETHWCPVCDTEQMVCRHLVKNRPDVYYDSYTWHCRGCGAVRGSAPWQRRGKEWCRDCDTIIAPVQLRPSPYTRCPDCDSPIGLASGGDGRD